MEYSFLNNNELVLVDYLPGSSGQLLSRLWCEFDLKQNYDDPQVMTPTGEIYHDTMFPKRVVNYFIEQQKPTIIGELANDYNYYFEFLATTLFACREIPVLWLGDNSTFYPEYTKPPVNERVVYHLHSWGQIPWNEVHKNIKVITIQSKTDKSRTYQINRGKKFLSNVPIVNQFVSFVDEWNNKQFDNSIDFCDILVSENTSEIIDWFKKQLGADFDQNKILKVELILKEYYTEVRSVSTVLE